MKNWRFWNYQVRTIFDWLLCVLDTSLGDANVYCMCTICVLYVYCMCTGYRPWRRRLWLMWRQFKNPTLWWIPTSTSWREVTAARNSSKLRTSQNVSHTSKLLPFRNHVLYIILALMLTLHAYILFFCTHCSFSSENCIWWEVAISEVYSGLWN